MSRVWTWRQALLETKLPATTKHVLMVISTHMNDMGEGCYPSTKRISGLASLSERAVCEHIASAIQLGWIESKVHGFNGQGWSRNEYRPSWPKGTYSDAEGTDPHAEGTDFDDRKALTEGQSNIPVKHSKEHSIVKKEKKNAKPLITLDQYLGEGESQPNGWECGPDGEWGKFCDYYIGKQIKWADWKRCWQGWLRRSAERKTPQQYGSHPAVSKYATVGSEVWASRMGKDGMAGSTTASVFGLKDPFEGTDGGAVSPMETSDERRG